MFSSSTAAKRSAQRAASAGARRAAAGRLILELQTIDRRCFHNHGVGNLNSFCLRTDDNEESLKKRFVTYEQATMPIIQHFEALNLVNQLDATK